MAKINKYANIYDIDGNLISAAPLKNFTIEQTEKLVDELTQKVKDNPDKEMYKIYLNNAANYLYMLYNTYGNPHEEELKELIKNAANKEVSEEEVAAALDAVNKEIEKTYNTDTLEDEYVQYSEVEGNSNGENMVSTQD